MSSNTVNQIKGGDPARKYFIMTPQLVWILCENPYQFTLWNVIKMIAAEEGECYLNTEQLATASMMSTGSCSQARRRLLDLGLLKGGIWQDAKYPFPVWHLRVPNLWPANIGWREQHDSLLERIELKREQSEALKRERSSLGEGRSSRDEERSSPGETKKNQKEEPVEEPIGVRS